jgi:hypothetical protein
MWIHHRGRLPPLDDQRQHHPTAGIPQTRLVVAASPTATRQSPAARVDENVPTVLHAHAAQVGCHILPPGGRWFVARSPGRDRVAPLLRTQAHVEAKRQDVVRTSDGHTATEPVAFGVDAAARQWHAASLAGPVEIRCSSLQGIRMAALAGGHHSIAPAPKHAWRMAADHERQRVAARVR